VGVKSKDERIKDLPPLTLTPKTYDLGFSVTKAVFADDHFDAHIKAMAAAKAAEILWLTKVWGQWL